MAEGELYWDSKTLTIVKLYGSKYCLLKAWNWQGSKPYSSLKYTASVSLSQPRRMDFLFFKVEHFQGIAVSNVSLRCAVFVVLQ